MNSKFVLRVLAAMGILALSATAAQAGDGGRVTPLTSFFVCHSINGSSANKTVDLQSPAFGPDRQSVKIGNGSLACFWAKLFTPGNTSQDQEVDHNPSSETDPTPPPGSGGMDQLKCYTLSSARKTSGPGTYNATDALFATVLPLVGLDGVSDPPGTETGIQASEMRFICGPAKFFR